MKYDDYEIEYSAQIENEVEPDEGQTKEEALKDVLGYHAGAVLKQHKPAKKSAFVITRFLSRPASGVGVYVDPTEKKIFIGTETEVQARLANN